ncbi:hypothetical protein GGI21_005505 [Coemansia aciculifera]|nr:hypothetical protein GGI21_005505 [Coemansia aciculifera]
MGKSGNGSVSKSRKTGKSKCLLDIPEPSSTMTAPIIEEDKSRTTTPKTFRIEPPSELLSRLHSFLPQIAEANKRLEVDIADDPHKLDIENVGEDDEQYIEMDLGLGVFDMIPKKDSGDAEHINTRAEEEEDDDGASRIVIDPSSIAARSRPKPQIEIIGSRMSDVDSDAAMDE